MDNHDWKKEYRNIDAYLANKYQTKPYTIHFIRVSSIKKSLSQKEIAFSIIRRLEQYKLDAHGVQQYRDMLDFIANLKSNEWDDITRSDNEAIGYMIEGAKLLEQKGRKFNKSND
jgi:hypothetical protein